MPAFTRDRKSRGTSKEHEVASRESLMSWAEERSRATGQSVDEAAAAVVEDLERAAASLTTRTTPLVPACGVLVAVTGLLVKAETSSLIADVFLSFAVLFAVAGLAFLTRGLFIYVGRRAIGLPPTAGDIAFTRDSLVRKHACTYRGSRLAAIGLACLIIGILVGININLG